MSTLPRQSEKERRKLISHSKRKDKNNLTEAWTNGQNVGLLDNDKENTG